jgi:nucleotide-binding universal stress UspA family protein
MGAQGRGFNGEIFLGSTSRAVGGKSHMPVLLIPPQKSKNWYYLSLK